MKCRICEEKNVYIDKLGKVSVANYYIEFKNKLGFWCKYRRVPEWWPSPLVVIFTLRKDAQSVITALQNGEIRNEGPSMIFISAIITIVVTTIVLSVITALQLCGVW
jgi:hypothetical protein